MFFLCILQGTVYTLAFLHSQHYTVGSILHHRLQLGTDTACTRPILLFWGHHSNRPCISHTGNLQCYEDNSINVKKKFGLLKLDGFVLCNENKRRYNGRIIRANLS